MPVYDDQDTLAHTPAGTAGSHDNPGEHPEHAAAEVADRERQFVSPSADPTPESQKAKEENPENGTDGDSPGGDTLGKGFTGRKSQTKTGALANLTKRRSAVSGGIVALLLAGGLGISIPSLSGLQMMHYSKILQTAFGHHEQTTTTKLGRIYQYMRTGEVGSTRLTFLEYKLYPKIVTSLEHTGTRFTTDRLTGQIRGMTIDPRKMPDLNGLNKEELIKYVSEHYGVEPNKVYVGYDGKNIGNVRFVATDLNFKQKDFILRDVVKQSGAGKMHSWMQVRSLRKFYTVPFHPFKRLSAFIDQKEIDFLRKSSKFREFEKKRTAPIATRSDEAQARLNKIKSRLGAGAAVAGFVLGGTEVVCTAYDIAESAKAINEENYIDPSTRSGMDAISAFEQVAAGSPDVEQESMDAYNENLHDPETNTDVFDSEAIRSLQGQAGGVPTSPSLKAAYSRDNSANNLKKGLEENAKADTLCSTGGKIATGLAGITLTVLGPGGWAVKGLSLAAGAAAGNIAMNFIQSTVPQLLAETPPIGTPHSGAVGGAFDAYGVMNAANVVSIAAGGTEMPQSEVIATETSWHSERAAEQRNKSFAQRLFDVRDYRSAVGIIIDSQSGDLRGSLSRVASSLSTVPIKAFGAFSSLLTRPVHAESPVVFDPSFRRYSFSSTLLNDPKYADPYANADIAAQFLDGPNGPRHISRALICSGYTISKVAGEKGQYWDVVKTTKVDTTSPEYLAAKCDDTSEEEWNRVVVLVGYTPLQESVSCGLGTDEVNQESCRRINQEGGARASPTATPRPTSLNKSDLFASSENIACYDNPATPEKETRDLGVHDGYWDGAKIPIRICAVSGFKSTGQESNDGYGVKGGGGDLVVNSRVSQNVYSMFIDAKNSGLILRAISGFRTMSHSEDLCPCDGTMISKPGYSNHQMGISIDFAGLIPKNRAAKVCETDRAKDLGQPTWEWLEKNAQKYGYRQLMYESWHWDPIPVASRCGGDGGG